MDTLGSPPGTPITLYQKFPFTIKSSTDQDISSILTNSFEGSLNLENKNCDEERKLGEQNDFEEKCNFEEKYQVKEDRNFQEECNFTDECNFPDECNFSEECNFKQKFDFKQKCIFKQERNFKQERIVNEEYTGYDTKLLQREIHPKQIHKSTKNSLKNKKFKNDNNKENKYRSCNKEKLTVDYAKTKFKKETPAERVAFCSCPEICEIHQVKCNSNGFLKKLYTKPVFRDLDKRICRGFECTKKKENKSYEFIDDSGDNYYFNKVTGLKRKKPRFTQAKSFKSNSCNGDSPECSVIGSEGTSIDWCKIIRSCKDLYEGVGLGCNADMIYDNDSTQSNKHIGSLCNDNIKESCDVKTAQKFEINKLILSLPKNRESDKCSIKSCRSSSKRSFNKRGGRIKIKFKRNLMDKSLSKLISQESQRKPSNNSREANSSIALSEIVNRIDKLQEKLDSKLSNSYQNKQEEVNELYEMYEHKKPQICEDFNKLMHGYENKDAMQNIHQKQNKFQNNHEYQNKQKYQLNYEKENNHSNKNKDVLFNNFSMGKHDKKQIKQFQKNQISEYHPNKMFEEYDKRFAKFLNTIPSKMKKDSVILDSSINWENICTYKESIGYKLECNQSVLKKLSLDISSEAKQIIRQLQNDFNTIFADLYIDVGKFFAKFDVQEKKKREVLEDILRSQSYLDLKRLQNETEKQP